MMSDINEKVVHTKHIPYFWKLIVFSFLLQSKQRASIKWLLSKAFNNRVPENLQEPFYRDHEVRQSFHRYETITVSRFYFLRIFAFLIYLPKVYFSDNRSLSSSVSLLFTCLTLTFVINLLSNIFFVFQDLDILIN